MRDTRAGISGFVCLQAATPRELTHSSLFRHLCQFSRLFLKFDSANSKLRGFGNAKKRAALRRDGPLLLLVRAAVFRQHLGSRIQRRVSSLAGAQTSVAQFDHLGQICPPPLRTFKRSSAFKGQRFPIKCIRGIALEAQQCRTLRNQD